MIQNRQGHLLLPPWGGAALMALVAVGVILFQSSRIEAQSPSNQPAAGAPTLRGIARVGEWITADPSGITDEDGLSNASFNFGWIVDPFTLNRARLLYQGPRFFVPPSDVGSTIEVQVGFRDDAGYFESLSSMPTAEVVPTAPDPPLKLGAVPSGSGALAVEWEAPTWSYSAWLFDGSTAVGDGGSPITSYTVQWREDRGSWTSPADVSEAVVPTGTSHTITGLTDGVTYAMRVLATNSVGDSEPSAEVTATSSDQPPPVTTGVIGGGGGASGPTPSEADYEWTVKHDLEALAAGHDTPTGMWSEGATLWVAHNGSANDDAVYAYDLETGERAEDGEFELDERNRAPRGVWSDRETMWVSDSGQERLFAYNLESGERDEEREIVLAARNRDARGIWSGDGVMWVLDGVKDSLFAYGLASGDLLGEYALHASNDTPHGLWSDGVGIWVSDHGAKRLFAYRLPEPAQHSDGDTLDLVRVRDEEFGLLTRASNNSPRGIWSDGDVMYVADASDGRIYTYNMPDAIDARLASLSLSGIDIGEFGARVTEYEGTPGDGVTETTVEFEKGHPRASVEIEPSDADGDDTNGHQIALARVGEITATVTSPDGSRTRAYRMTFEPPEVELALEVGFNAIEWTGLDGIAITEALGGIPVTVVVVYAWDEAPGTWLAFFPGLEEVPGVNTLAALEQGRTYWVAVAEPVTWAVSER